MKVLIDALLDLHETAYDETVPEYVKVHEINEREQFISFSANPAGVAKVQKSVENRNVRIIITSCVGDVSDYRLEFFL